MRNKRIRELAEKVFVLDIEENPQFNMCLQQFADLIIEDIGDIIRGLTVKESFGYGLRPWEYWNKALGHLVLEIKDAYGERQPRPGPPPNSEPGNDTEPCCTSKRTCEIHGDTPPREWVGLTSEDFDEYCKTLDPLWNANMSRTYAEMFFWAGEAKFREKNK